MGDLSRGVPRRLRRPDLARRLRRMARRRWLGGRLVRHPALVADAAGLRSTRAAARYGLQRLHIAGVPAQGHLTPVNADADRAREGVTDSPPCALGVRDGASNV